MRRCLLLFMLLSACASPNPRLYTLASVPGPAVAAPARIIDVHPVGLARYLDRPGIVARVDPYRVTLVDNARWAEPFPDMLSRVLAADLARRLPNSTVFTAASPITAPPDLGVEVDIQRFDALARFELVATIALQKSGQAAKVTHFRRAAPMPSGGEESQIATMSALLGELADDIAAMIGHEPGLGAP
jgi:uncharacterized lipoprotein YmbA